MQVLIVVDMQRDFVDGALGTREAQEIVPHVAERVKEAARRGERILFTRDTHEENYLDTQEGRKLPVPHCLRGTAGWEIIEPLQRETQGRTVLDKPTFASAELGELLRRENGRTPIEKVTALFTNPDERRAAFAVLADGGRYLVTSSIPRNVEVNAAGVDKGVGLLALADFLGVPHGAVMACGDSSNDAAMLRAAGFSVAMGNASDEIKALADFVTDTNDADGVAKAVERWVLGAPQV